MKLVLLVLAAFVAAVAAECSKESRQAAIKAAMETLDVCTCEEGHEFKPLKRAFVKKAKVLEKVRAFCRSNDEKVAKEADMAEDAGEERKRDGARDAGARDGDAKRTGGCTGTEEEVKACRAAKIEAFREKIRMATTDVKMELDDDTKQKIREGVEGLRATFEEQRDEFKTRFEAARTQASASVDELRAAVKACREAKESMDADADATCTGVREKVEAFKTSATEARERFNDEIKALRAEHSEARQALSDKARSQALSDDDKKKLRKAVDDTVKRFKESAGEEKQTRRRGAFAACMAELQKAADADARKAAIAKCRADFLEVAKVDAEAARNHPKREELKEKCAAAKEALCLKFERRMVAFTDASAEVMEKVGGCARYVENDGGQGRIEVCAPVDEVVTEESVAAEEMEVEEQEAGVRKRDASANAEAVYESHGFELSATDGVDEFATADTTGNTANTDVTGTAGTDTETGNTRASAGADENGAASLSASLLLAAAVLVAAALF